MINQKQTLTASSIKTKASTTVEYRMLQDGYCIPKALCDSVKFEVESILPAMIPNVNYTLRDLCGEEYWNQLGAGTGKLAGRFMADLVSRNLLPLSFGIKTDANAKTYRLK
jgi:hypothetical protein